jgi:TnpA family transposase
MPHLILLATENSGLGLNVITGSLIISNMSEENTQNMLDSRSFEERVFARFDALDARLQKLESEAERRALETKPIWERALAEILEVQQGLNEFRSAVDDALRDLSRKLMCLAMI